MPDTLFCSWTQPFSNILIVFFARYVHKSGKNGSEQGDSYYEGTYRGEADVDLWMNGEGMHHQHHAKER